MRPTIESAIFAATLGALLAAGFAVAPSQAQDRPQIGANPAGQLPPNVSPNPTENPALEQEGGVRTGASGSVPARQEVATFTRDQTMISRVVDQSVYTTNGEKVGDVEDIVIDRYSGQIEFLVVEVGGFLGLGEKRVAVPWPSISFDPQTSGEKIVLSMTEAQIAELPDFGVTVKGLLPQE